MLELTHARGKSYALFGLGASGIATSKALKAGGASVMCWDDNDDSRAKAQAAGLDVADLRSADWSAFDNFILSPGVPLTHPEPHWTVTLAEAAGVGIIGDIELFCRERRLRAPRSKLIAITGTNGKSTTTALTAHVLREAGLNVQMGGNIGRPALDLDLTDDACFVLECSSYQIDLAPSLDPDIGVLLNISEDHIDRHGSVGHYADVKERLIEGVKQDGLAIIGIDDVHSAAISENVKQRKTKLVEISLQNHGASITLKDHALYEGDRLLIDLKTCPALRGAHNAQNAAAAFSAARACGVSEPHIVAAMQSFPGLAHRMQAIGRVGNVVFVNDSKATNADAAAKALGSYDNIFWIAGGRAKTGGIESLKGFFPHIRRAYLIGEAADMFAASLNGAVPVTLSKTIDRAVVDAAQDAQNADLKQAVVLLSPACASFDQYKNFEARGDAFTRAVMSLPHMENIA